LRIKEQETRLTLEEHDDDDDDDLDLGTCLTRACLIKLLVLAISEQPAHIRQYL